MDNYSYTISSIDSFIDTEAEKIYSLFQYISKEDRPICSKEHFNEALYSSLYDICEFRKINKDIINKGDISDLKKVNTYLEKLTKILLIKNGKIEHLIQKNSTRFIPILNNAEHTVASISSILSNITEDAQYNSKTVQRYIIHKFFDLLMITLSLKSLPRGTTTCFPDILEFLIYKVESKLFDEGKTLTDGLPTSYQGFQESYFVLHAEKSSTRAHIVHLLNEFK